MCLAVVCVEGGCSKSKLSARLTHNRKLTVIHIFEQLENVAIVIAVRLRIVMSRSLPLQSLYVLLSSLTLLCSGQMDGNNAGNRRRYCLHCIVYVNLNIHDTHSCYYSLIANFIP